MISVALFSVIYTSVLSTDVSPNTPSVNIVGSIQGNNLVLDHCGGMSIGLDTKIILDFPDDSMNREMLVVRDSEYLDNFEKQDGEWNIGERVEVDLSYFPYYQIDDLIHVTVVDIESNSVIMHGTVRATDAGTIYYSPEVTVTNPSGGTVQDIIDIQWSATDADGDDNDLLISIYISSDGMSWEDIVLNTDNDGSYQLDTNSIADDDYQIRVVAEDSDSNTGEDISDTFAIRNIDGVPQVSIMYPDGGTVVDTITIAWTATDLEDGTNLDVSLFIRLEGESWQAIVSNPVANTGTHLFDTTTKADGNYQIRVVAEDSDSNTGEDISPIFEIKNFEEHLFTIDEDVASSGSSISICDLTSNSFVVAYGVEMGDTSYDDGYVGVRVGIVSDGEILFGQEYTFPSCDWGIDLVKIAKLDSTHFILTYPENSLSGIYAVVGTVSGDTISFSYKTSCEPSGLNTKGGYTIDVLSSTRFVVAFYEVTASDLDMEIDIGEISNNFVTFNNDLKIDLDQELDNPVDRQGPVKVAGLDHRHYVISYSYISGGHTYAAARIYEIYEVPYCNPLCKKDPSCNCPMPEPGISGFGDEYTFAGLGLDNAYVTSICSLDNSHFVVRYAEGGAGKTIIGAVSGTDISFGNPSGSLLDSYPPVLTKLDDTHFIAAGPRGDSGGPGKVKMGAVSGVSITPSTTYEFREETTAYVDVSGLDSQKFLVAFKDVVDYGFQGYKIGPGKVMVLPVSVFG